MEKRTPEEAKLIRLWAEEKNVPVAAKGPIPDEIIWEWIKDHVGLRPKVIHQWRVDKGAKRHVEILCYKCAHIHEELVKPGTRGFPSRFSKNIICYLNGSTTYEYRDHMPLMNWEKEILAKQTEGTNDETD